MNEKTALQVAIAIAGLVPVTAGIFGAWQPGLLELAATPSSATHAAYLSGLLLGIGLAFWFSLPGVERHRSRFTLLTAIIVIGGLARLFTAARLGAWGPTVTLPLVMELGVTPAMWLWQGRVARLFARA